MKISLIINVLHHAICVFSNAENCEFVKPLDCVRLKYQRLSYIFEKTFCLPQERSFFCNLETEASIISIFPNSQRSNCIIFRVLVWDRYITLTATSTHDANKALFTIPEETHDWVATADTKFDTRKSESRTIYFDLNEEKLVLPESFKKDIETKKDRYDFCLTKEKTTGCIEVHDAYIIFRDVKDVTMGWRDMARFGVQFRKDGDVYSVAFGVSPQASTDGLEATWTEQ